LHIIRAICADLVNVDRLTEKETRTYCNIVLDNNVRKSILRLYFNSMKKKKVIIFDQDRPEPISVKAPKDLYQYQERIRKALTLKLEPGG